MKKLQQLIRILPIIIGVLFVTSITSCSSDDNNNSFNESDLIGQWKLDNMNVNLEGNMDTNGISLPLKFEINGTGENYYLTFNEDHTFDATGSITYISKTYVNNILMDTFENTFDYDNYTFENNTWEIVNGNELHSGLIESATNNPNITVISNNTVTTITTLTDTELALTLSGEIITLDNSTNTETTMIVSGESHYTRN